MLFLLQFSVYFLVLCFQGVVTLFQIGHTLLLGGSNLYLFLQGVDLCVPSLKLLTPLKGDLLLIPGRVMNDIRLDFLHLLREPIIYLLDVILHVFVALVKPSQIFALTGDPCEFLRIITLFKHPKHVTFVIDERSVSLLLMLNPREVAD